MPMPGWIQGLRGAAARGWQSYRQNMQLGFNYGLPDSPSCFVAGKSPGSRPRCCKVLQRRVTPRRSVARQQTRRMGTSRHDRHARRRCRYRSLRHFGHRDWSRLGHGRSGDRWRHVRHQPHGSRLSQRDGASGKCWHALSLDGRLRESRWGSCRGHGQKHGPTDRRCRKRSLGQIAGVGRKLHGRVARSLALRASVAF
jgi:hypothetical protein